MGGSACRDGFNFMNNPAGRECVRRKTVSRVVERRKALHFRGRSLLPEPVGIRTLNAPMQTERKTPHHQLAKRTQWSVGAGFAIVLIAVSSAMAQTGSTPSIDVASPTAGVVAAPALVDAPEAKPERAGAADLPNDPGQSMAASKQSPVAPEQGDVDPARGRVAPIHAKYIFPGVRAQPLGARDKLIIGLKDSYSVMNFGGMFAASGYEQLRNGEPHYGSDRGAFGERLGAAGIRDTAQGVLTDGVYAPLLHQDTRYYVEGSRYGTFHRALYALTRPLISRSDSGRPMINGAQLLGYASAIAISETFYPPVDQNASSAAKAYGGSIGGAALGSLLIEFTSSFWHDFHIGPKE